MLIPKTEANNVGMICSNCADQRKKELNATAYEPDYFVGKFCKLGFPIASTTADRHAKKPRNEYMWVKVLMLADTPGQELLGTLANDPVYATQLAFGDLIEFNREEIHAVEG